MWSKAASPRSSTTLMIGYRGMQRGHGEKGKGVKTSFISRQIWRKVTGLKKEGKRSRVMHTSYLLPPCICASTLRGKHWAATVVHLSCNQISSSLFKAWTSELDDPETSKNHWLVIKIFLENYQFLWRNSHLLTVVPTFVLINYRWELVTNAVAFKLYFCHLSAWGQIYTCQHCLFLLS